jgi:ABC-2 type transport system ATP-binding protein
MLQMAAIKTQELTKRYGEVVALEGLDLSVREGEVFGFLGPNGAGKSTTINLLLGFLSPTEGSGTVLGHDIVSEPRKARRTLGILPEGYSPYERLTAREHLDYAIAAKEADDNPDELLDRVDWNRKHVGGRLESTRRGCDNGWGWRQH